MEKQNTAESFQNLPVTKAILVNALPAMAAMIMVLIYNLADTFFIGQTHNDILVASVSLATPVFLIFMSVGTVFGMGGTSAISRALGEGKKEYASRICAFCMWGCVAAGLVISGLFLTFMDELLALIGASEQTLEYAREYLTIVSLCGPFVLIANCFNNIIRAEGKSAMAMSGQLVGNLVNVILDPIMILGFGWGIAGAAWATVAGNVIGALIYIGFYLSGKSMLSVNIRLASGKDHVFTEVMAIGIPASLNTILMSVSQIIVNSLMAGYGDLSLAGIGVAMKVTMITGMICIGFGQGIQPLLGYCVGAGLWPRFKEVMKKSSLIGLCLSLAMTLFCFIFTRQLVCLFLTDPEAIQYGVLFVRILLSTSSLFGLFYVYANALQAMGCAGASLIVNVSRQGLIYIPALFILRYIMGQTGLVWAQPLADVLSTVLVFWLYSRNVRRMERKSSMEDPVLASQAG